MPCFVPIRESSGELMTLSLFSMISFVAQTALDSIFSLMLAILILLHSYIQLLRLKKTHVHQVHMGVLDKSQLVPPLPLLCSLTIGHFDNPHPTVLSNVSLDQSWATESISQIEMSELNHSNPVSVRTLAKVRFGVNLNQMQFVSAISAKLLIIKDGVRHMAERRRRKDRMTSGTPIMPCKQLSQPIRRQYRGKVRADIKALGACTFRKAVHWTSNHPMKTRPLFAQRQRNRTKQGREGRG